MNKFSFFTRFPFSLALFVFLSAFQSGQAQGFFTPTQHAQFSEHTIFDELPGGYRLRNTYRAALPAGEIATYFGDLSLNAAGQEIGWDSITRLGAYNDPFYTWLPDNDLLEILPASSGFNIGIKKLHLDGSVVWSNTISTEVHKTVHDVESNAAGEIFVSGHEYNNDPFPQTYFLFIPKYDINGQLLWMLHQPLPLGTDNTFSGLTPTQDGGCVYHVNAYLMFSPSPTISLLGRVSNSGQTLWIDTLDYLGTHVRENSAGDIFSLGETYTQNVVLRNTKLEKRNAAGQLLWHKDLNVLFQKTSVEPSELLLANNGDVLVIGTEVIAGPDFQPFFARFDTDGNLIWKRHYPLLGISTHAFNLSGGMATQDGGFLVAGILPFLDYQLFILKLGAAGNIYPGQLAGQLGLDSNVDCLTDSSEHALVNWKVQLTSPNYHLYTTTDSSGRYEMPDVPGDDYLLSALLPSNLWESCIGNTPVSVPDTGSLTLTQDLPIQVLTDCPFMTVDIGTARLRRCMSSDYTVHYCNSGTVATDSAYIQVVLDPLLQFQSATIPPIQNGDSLYFFLGSVQSLECGDFTFSVQVNCDSAMLGQTLCVSARIFPDTICNPPANWSGALLEGSGYCDGDSIRFQLHNIGLAPTSSGLDFIIADDHVIMFNQPLPPLGPDDRHNVVVPSNGTTWRMLADQEPNAPGSEMPSVGVEGCGTGATSPFGFMLQFPNRDGNPFTDRDCHEVVGSFDPNDKQAFPIGIGNQHYIEQNTPLDYQIRFQNTGNDTAFTVVVKDVLSPWLDPATIRPGASSHPYTWALSGTGILTVTFENILLPDSNINEAASHGFVQFSIEQRPDNPLGALLENRADIYFDFNAPVLTNTVWHTIGHDFLTIATREPKAALSLLQIWPNLASQVTTVQTGKLFRPGQQLVVRDVLGRTVQAVALSGQSVDLQRAGLSSGLYFVELQEAGRIVATGKLIWK